MPMQLTWRGAIWAVLYTAVAQCIPGTYQNSPYCLQTAMQSAQARGMEDVAGRPGAKGHQVGMVHTPQQPVECTHGTHLVHSVAICTARRSP